MPCVPTQCMLLCTLCTRASKKVVSWETLQCAVNDCVNQWSTTSWQNALHWLQQQKSDKMAAGRFAVPCLHTFTCNWCLCDICWTDDLSCTFWCNIKDSCSAVESNEWRGFTTRMTFSKLPWAWDWDKFHFVLQNMDLLLLSLHLNSKCMPS